MSDIVLDDCIKCGPNPPRTIGSREFFSGTPTEPKHIVDSAECIQRQLDQKDAEIRVLERALSNLYCAAISRPESYIAPPESWKSQACTELTEEAQACKEVSDEPTT